MFELIISSVITGKVVRKTFKAREQAERYADRFFDGGTISRLRRNYRVEIHTRTQPAPSPTVRPAVAASAA